LTIITAYANIRTMVSKATQTNHNEKHETSESLLSKFNLAYEWDKSWKEAKQDIRSRTER